MICFCMLYLFFPLPYALTVFYFILKIFNIYFRGGVWQRKAEEERNSSRLCSESKPTTGLHLPTLRSDLSGNQDLESLDWLHHPGTLFLFLFKVIFPTGRIRLNLAFLSNLIFSVPYLESLGHFLVMWLRKCLAWRLCFSVFYLSQLFFPPSLPFKLRTS